MPQKPKSKYLSLISLVTFVSLFGFGIGIVFSIKGIDPEKIVKDLLIQKPQEIGKGLGSVSTDLFIQKPQQLGKFIRTDAKELAIEIPQSIGENLGILGYEIPLKTGKTLGKVSYDVPLTIGKAIDNTLLSLRAERSNPELLPPEPGLLRRSAPRNDTDSFGKVAGVATTETTETQSPPTAENGPRLSFFDKIKQGLNNFTSSLKNIYGELSRTTFSNIANIFSPKKPPTVVPPSAEEIAQPPQEQEPPGSTSPGVSEVEHSPQVLEKEDEEGEMKREK